MEIERLRSDCMFCMLKKYTGLLPEEATDKEKVAFLQKLFLTLGEAKKSTSAPMIVRMMDQVLWEMFGIRKDYSQEKKYFNQVMLERETEIGQRVVAAEDPIMRGIQYAMVGNYIDFGAMNHVSEEYLTGLLDVADEKPLDEKTYGALKDDLAKAKHLVYITDNCGEIVLDKILIKQLQAFYPNLEITAMVRGGNVLNDATMEDAEQVRLTKITRVIDNGNTIGGTCIDELSKEAKETLLNADVILAKGQGNFETMRLCGLNVYYIFLCKCDLFAKSFGVPRYTGMLINDKDCRK